MATLLVLHILLFSLISVTLSARQTGSYSSYYRQNVPETKNTYDYNSEYVRRVVRSELDSFKYELQRLLSPDRQSSHMMTTMSQQVASLTERMESVMRREPQNVLTRQIEQRFQSWFQLLEGRANQDQSRCENLARTISDLSHKMDYLKQLVQQRGYSSTSQNHGNYHYNRRQGVQQQRDEDQTTPSPRLPVHVDSQEDPQENRVLEGSRSSAVYAGSYYDQRRAHQLQGQRIPEERRRTVDRASSDTSVEVLPTARPRPSPRPAESEKDMYTSPPSHPKQNYYHHDRRQPTKTSPTPARRNFEPPTVYPEGNPSRRRDENNVDTYRIGDQNVVDVSRRRDANLDRSSRKRYPGLDRSSRTRAPDVDRSSRTRAPDVDRATRTRDLDLNHPSQTRNPDLDRRSRTRDQDLVARRTKPVIRLETKRTHKQFDDSRASQEERGEETAETIRRFNYHKHIDRPQPTSAPVTPRPSINRVYTYDRNRKWSTPDQHRRSYEEDDEEEEEEEEDDDEDEEEDNVEDDEDEDREHSRIVNPRHHAPSFQSHEQYGKFYNLLLQSIFREMLCYSNACIKSGY